MCLGGRGSAPTAPPPAPLPPPPAAPPPPPPPLPAPKILDDEVNPQVRRAKSKKAKGADARGGTGDLRIDLKPNINTGTAGEAGGLSK